MSSLSDLRKGTTGKQTISKSPIYLDTYEVCGSQLNLLPFYTIRPFLLLSRWAVIAVIKAIKLISRSPNNVSVKGSWWSADGKALCYLPTNFISILSFKFLGIFMFEYLSYRWRVLRYYTIRWQVVPCQALVLTRHPSRKAEVLVVDSPIHTTP